jgi:hypothetical protein
MAADWDAKNQDDIADRMLEYRDENIGNRFTIAIYAVLATLIPPLLYPIFILKSPGLIVGWPVVLS